MVINLGILPTVHINNLKNNSQTVIFKQNDDFCTVMQQVADDKSYIKKILFLKIHYFISYTLIFKELIFITKI